MENLQERMYKSNNQARWAIYNPYYSTSAVGRCVIVHNVMGSTQPFSGCLIRKISSYLINVSRFGFQKRAYFVENAKI